MFESIEINLAGFIVKGLRDTTTNEVFIRVKETAEMFNLDPRQTRSLFKSFEFTRYDDDAPLINLGQFQVVIEALYRMGNYRASELKFLLMQKALQDSFN